MFFQKVLEISSKDASPQTEANFCILKYRKLLSLQCAELIRYIFLKNEIFINIFLHICENFVNTFDSNTFMPNYPQSSSKTHSFTYLHDMKEYKRIAEQEEKKRIWELFSLFSIFQRIFEKASVIIIIITRNIFSKCDNEMFK